MSVKHYACQKAMNVNGLMGPVSIQAMYVPTRTPIALHAVTLKRNVMARMFSAISLKVFVKAQVVHVWEHALLVVHSSNAIVDLTVCGIQIFINVMICHVPTRTPIALPVVTLKRNAMARMFNAISLKVFV